MDVLFSLSDPLEAPLDVGLILINSTAIKVTWAAVNRETVRGRLQGYKVTYCDCNNLCQKCAM